MKERLLQIISLGLVIVSILITTEIVIFADANIKILFTNQGNSAYNFGNTVSEPCKEPFIQIAKAEFKREKRELLKDSNLKLAFMCGDTISAMPLEEYLIGVVISEIPYTYEYEAIKAQAVAARTYALYISTVEPRHEKYTVCSSSSHCSGYLSKEDYILKYGDSAYEKAYAIIKSAVNDTDGEIIKYDDTVCCAVYHASSYGTTENSYNLWGTVVPYLKSVKTPESTDTSVITVGTDKMLSFLSRYGYSNGNLADVTQTFNDSGRCESVTIAGVNIPADKFRGSFGLRSCDFTLTYSNNTYTFTSYGYGHGIGMSQVGANELAKLGKTYIDILTHYYSGVELTQY